MQRFLVVFLLFLLPFVVFPFGTSPYETPKLFVAEVAIELLVLLIILKKVTVPFLKSKLLVAALSGIVLLSLVHVLFLGTDTTFFGNAFRLQGVFFLLHLFVFFFVAVAVPLETFRGKLPLIVFLLLAGATLFGGVNENGRFVATLGEPNSLAAAIIYLWPFAYFLSPFPKKKSVFFIILFALVIISILLLSGSRSGMIAVSLQLSFLLLTHLLKQPFWQNALICFLLYTLSYMFPFLEGGGRFENRAEIWKTAVTAGFEKPLLGHGFGNIEQSLFATSYRINTNVKYQFVDSTHNIFLDWFVQGGIIGLLLFLTILIGAMKNFIVNKRTVAFTLFLGLLTMLSFNPMSVTIYIAFWYTLAQGWQRS